MAPQSVIKRQVTVGELIGFGITVLAGFLYFYVSTNVRLTLLENTRNTQQENYIEMKADIKQSFTELGGKVDELNKGQNEIKITLQNKQDRK